MTNTNEMKLSEACRVLSVPYSTAYANLHKLSEPFGIIISEKSIYCDRNKISKLVEKLEGYTYYAERNSQIRPWELSRMLIDRGYIQIGCFGFVKKDFPNPEN